MGDSDIDENDIDKDNINDYIGFIAKKYNDKWFFVVDDDLIKLDYVDKWARQKYDKNKMTQKNNVEDVENVENVEDADAAVDANEYYDNDAENAIYLMEYI